MNAALPHDSTLPFVPCVPVSLDFFETAPVRFRFSKELPVSPERLFAIFEDPDSWSRWATGIGGVEWTSPAPYGVGTTRTVTFWGGVKVYEDFIAWQPGREMAFTFYGTTELIWVSFGEHYRVIYEESYYAQYGERARVVDPWLMIIPCQYGHLYPHGDDMLGFATDKKGPLAKRLSRLDFVTTHQDGDDGVNVVLPAERFEEVARIVKPKRRRQLSEAQKATLRKHAMKPGYDSRRAKLRVDGKPCEDWPDSALESPVTPAPDSELMSGIPGPKWPA